MFSEKVKFQISLFIESQRAIGTFVGFIARVNYFHVPFVARFAVKKQTAISTELLLFGRFLHFIVAIVLTNMICFFNRLK